GARLPPTLSPYTTLFRSMISSVGPRLVKPTPGIVNMGGAPRTDWADHSAARRPNDAPHAGACRSMGNGVIWGQGSHGPHGPRSQLGRAHVGTPVTCKTGM